MDAAPVRPPTPSAPETPQAPLTLTTAATPVRRMRRRARPRNRPLAALAACAALASSLFLALASAACKNETTNGDNGGSLLTISGTITQNGVAQAGVVIYLSWTASKSTTTGADGKFQFKDLAAGQYYITPVRLGSAFSPSNYQVASSRADANFTAAPATYGSEVGSIVAGFTAKNQSGSTFNIADNIGNVILIDFTADWCVPCREKAQTAEAFYQKYKGKGFVYVLIVIQGSPSAWASTYGLTFPVLDDNVQAIYNIYRKSSIPLPHVLDRNMTIRYKVEGFNQGEVEDWLNKLL